MLALAVTVVLAVAAGIVVVDWSSRTPPAALVCARCGHRFEATAEEYRAMKPGPSGLLVQCPKCGKPAAEPVVAVCPHCRKPIRRSDLDHTQPGYARRLCPHCGKNVPP